MEPEPARGSSDAIPEPRPHAMPRHCDSLLGPWPLCSGGGGRAGEAERAGTADSPTEQKCRNMAYVQRKRDSFTDVEVSSALNFNTPICCTEEALRSPTCSS